MFYQLVHTTQREPFKQPNKPTSKTTLHYQCTNVIRWIQIFNTFTEKMGRKYKIPIIHSDFFLFIALRFGLVRFVYFKHRSQSINSVELCVCAIYVVDQCHCLILIANQYAEMHVHLPKICKSICFFFVQSILLHLTVTWSYALR